MVTGEWSLITDFIAADHQELQSSQILLARPGPSFHASWLATVELPDELQAVAHSEDGVVQGIRHKTLRITGVQFHPESIMTTAGMDLLANFLSD